MDAEAAPCRGDGAAVGQGSTKGASGAGGPSCFERLCSWEHGLRALFPFLFLTDAMLWVSCGLLTPMASLKTQELNAENKLTVTSLEREGSRG